MRHDEVIDLMPELILGHLSDDEAARLEDHLETCPECASEFTQASAVHLLASASADAPPPHLRERVLARAFEARPHNAHAPTPAAIGAWLTETARFRAVVDDVDALADPMLWQAPCVTDFDLSVRDVVCHLIATNSRWLHQIEPSLMIAPEADDDLEQRTRATVARHEALSVAETVAEYDLVTNALIARIEVLDPKELAADSELMPGLSVGDYLLLQALETWTHSDDIRIAIGAPEYPPSAKHLHAMTGLLDLLIADVMTRSNPLGTTRRYVIELDGPGGRVCDVTTGPAAEEYGPPDAVIACSAVEFCKLAAARRDPADFPYQARGEMELAEGLIHSMPELAMI